MLLDKISVGANPPDEVNVIIEVPIGGEPIKYEIDKASGILVVDRFLYTSMRYPGNYGFIPHTLSGDGDPCDVLIVNTRAITPGAMMSVRPVGVLFMEDEAGLDEKIIAVPASRLTRRYDSVQSYSDLPTITIQQVQHFFEHYKDLEPGKWVKVVKWGDVADAHRVILEGCDARKNRGLTRGQPVPPTVMRSIRNVGWPTPTGTPWPFLPQVPMPSSSWRSLPTMAMRCRSVGPLPISIAPFTGAPTLPFSIL